MSRTALMFSTVAAIALVAVALFASRDFTPTASAGVGFDAMSVDAVTTGNTATELGEQNDCVEVNAGDSVDVDVTVLNIPASNPMITYNFRLLYDEDNITVTAADNEFLITAAPGSAIPPLSAGDTVPDADGSFLTSVVDTEVEAAESGSGVLSRVTLMVDADAPDGGYLLALQEAAYVDDQNMVQGPDDLNLAQLAVGVTCASLPPPEAAFIQGDIDCDDDVDAVDALQLLRFVAGLGANQPQGCPPLGEPIGDTIFGDIDCDGDVDAVDALQILRHVAGLGANQPQGCQPVGE